MPDYPITLNPRRVSVQKLPNEHGYTHKFKLLASDVAVSAATAATDTVTVTLGTSPSSRWACTKAFAVINTAYSGTTALTVQVGTTTAISAFLAATSVLSGSHIVPSGGFNSTATPGSSFGTTTTSLVARFTNATGGSPSALTAGDIDLYLTLVDTTKIDGPLA